MNSIFDSTLLSKRCLNLALATANIYFYIHFSFDCQNSNANKLSFTQKIVYVQGKYSKWPKAVAASGGKQSADEVQDCIRTATEVKVGFNTETH